MTDLHPTAIELAKVKAECTKAAARLAVLRKELRDKKRALREAITESLADGDVRNVDLAARFGVVEGTIRRARMEQQQPDHDAV